MCPSRDVTLRQVAPPTPLRENVCPPPPPPPEGVVVNEVSVARWTNQSRQQGSFVELVGPPLTPLKGLVLLALGEEDRGAAILALPLTGSTDSGGFYLVGNVTGAGNHPRAWVAECVAFLSDSSWALNR